MTPWGGVGWGGRGGRKHRARARRPRAPPPPLASPPCSHLVGHVLERGRPDLFRHLERAVDAVVAVEQDFGLDDRDEARSLRDGAVAREPVGRVAHRDRGRAGGHGHGRAPLAEAGALLVVLGRALEGGEGFLGG